MIADTLERIAAIQAHAQRIRDEYFVVKQRAGMERAVRAGR